MKCHHPEVFLAAILNAQPMGFYAPAQLVRDAEHHGVEIRPPDINHRDGIARWSQPTVLTWPSGLGFAPREDSRTGTAP